MLEAYKAWVRKHPGVVSNFDWLLYLTVWSPSRQNSAASELQYERYHALVGLLSVWHQHIIDEPNHAPGAKPGPALWLDLLEQVSKQPRACNSPSPHACTQAHSHQACQCALRHGKHPTILQCTASAACCWGGWGAPQAVPCLHGPRSSAQSNFDRALACACRWRPSWSCGPSSWRSLGA